jgi:hypothetical protein
MNRRSDLRAQVIDVQEANGLCLPLAAIKPSALFRKQDPTEKQKGWACLLDGMTLPSPNSQELYFQLVSTLKASCAAALGGAVWLVHTCQVLY